MSASHHPPSTLKYKYKEFFSIEIRYLGFFFLSICPVNETWSNYVADLNFTGFNSPPYHLCHQLPTSPNCSCTCVRVSVQVHLKASLFLIHKFLAWKVLYISFSTCFIFYFYSCTCRTPHLNQEDTKDQL